MNVLRFFASNKAFLLTAFVAGTFTNAAHAAIAIRAGLWEQTAQAELTPAQKAQQHALLQSLENLPPGQKEIIRKQMMQQGMDVQLAADKQTMRMCITEADIAENFKRTAQNMLGGKGNCEPLVQRVGDTLKVQYQCQAPLPSNGQGEYRLLSSESFNGHLIMTHAGKGKQVTRLVFSGRWLGADCQGLPPVSQGPKATASPSLNSASATTSPAQATRAPASNAHHATDAVKQSLQQASRGR